MKSREDTAHTPDPLARWHLTPANNTEYHFLDGLRGVAILMVVCCHFIYVNPQSGGLVRWIGRLAQAGTLGVPVFFTLSGFLISWPFWKQKMRPRAQVIPNGYFKRRFYKIYPPILCSFLILVPFYIYINHDTSYLRLAAEWLVGLPLFAPVEGRLNPVMWSLVIEVQFYITLPWLMLILKRVPLRACLWILPGVLFGLGFSNAALRSGLPNLFSGMMILPFPSQIDQFALGALVAGLHCQGWIKSRHSGWSFVGALLFLATVLVAAALRSRGPSTFFEDEAMASGMQVSTALLLLCIANPHSYIRIFLSNLTLRWCGIVSYEWYLYHLPLIAWSRQFFGFATGSLEKYATILGLPLIASLLLTSVTYRFISLPILRFGRGGKVARAALARP